MSAEELNAEGLSAEPLSHSGSASPSAPRPLSPSAPQLESQALVTQAVEPVFSPTGPQLLSPSAPTPFSATQPPQPRSPAAPQPPSPASPPPLSPSARISSDDKGSQGSAGLETKASDCHSVAPDLTKSQFGTEGLRELRETEIDFAIEDEEGESDQPVHSLEWDVGPEFQSPSQQRYSIVKIGCSWCLISVILYLVMLAGFAWNISRLPVLGCFSMELAGNWSSGDPPGMLVRKSVESFPVSPKNKSCYNSLVADSGRFIRQSSGSEWYFLHCVDCRCERCLDGPPTVFTLEPPEIGLHYAYTHQSCSGKNWNGKTQDQCFDSNMFNPSWRSTFLQISILLVDMLVVIYTHKIEGFSAFVNFKILCVICELLVVMIMIRQLMSVERTLDMGRTDFEFLLVGMVANQCSLIFLCLAVISAQRNNLLRSGTFSARKLHPVFQRLVNLRVRMDELVWPVLTIRSSSLVLINMFQSFLSWGLHQGLYIYLWLYTDVAKESYWEMTTAQTVVTGFVKIGFRVFIPLSEARRRSQ